MLCSKLPWIVCALLMVSCAQTKVPAPKPPELAGQKAPDKQIELDLSKRYDVWIGSPFGTPAVGDSNQVYRSCRIIGFTGGGMRDGGISFGGSGAFPGSIDNLLNRSHFTGWLVLQRPDGRKIFLPATQISRLEES
jgi:hypothetical protein